MKKRGRPAVGQRLARATRINEILKDLVDGKSDVATLAAKHGISTRQVHYDIQEAIELLQASRLEDAEQFRALQLSRHENYLDIINQQINNGVQGGIAAGPLNGLMLTGLRILDQENKLLGLYTTNIAVKSDTKVHFEMPKDQGAEMLALMESLGLTPPAQAVPAEFRELDPDDAQGAALEPNPEPAG